MPHDLVLSKATPMRPWSPIYDTEGRKNGRLRTRVMGRSTRGCAQDRRSRRVSEVVNHISMKLERDELVVGFDQPADAVLQR